MGLAKMWVSTTSMDRKIQKKKWSWKKALLWGGLPLVCVFLAYGFYQNTQQHNLSVNRDRIRISKVKMGSFQEYVPVRGSVLPINTLYLDSPEGGQVLEIFVEEGATVEKGQPLLRLENKELELLVRNQEETINSEVNQLEEMRLNQEQSQLEQKQQMAQMDFDIEGLRRSYDRKAALWEDGLVPELDYINAKAEYEYSQKRKQLMLELHEQEQGLQETQIQRQSAIVERRSQDLTLIRSRLDTLILKAPVSGQLTSFDAEVGESKSKGQRIGMIDVLDSLKVQGTVDEHYLPRLQKGLEGSFEISGQTYALNLIKIYPEIEEGNVTFDMEFSSTIPDHLRRGQTLQIRLALGDSHEALLLPRGNFYQTTGGNWIFVLSQNGNLASRRSIRLGRQNAQSFEVLEGLEAGEEVVTSSYENYETVDALVIR